MDRSQYLAQALQQMQAQPAQTSPQGLSLDQMQQIAQAKQAFEAANPGQSYMAHGLGQMGANLTAAPGRALSGLQRMVQRPAGMPAPAAMPSGPLPPY